PAPSHHHDTVAHRLDSAVLFPSPPILRRRTKAPDVRRQSPDLGPLRTVAMPGSRLVIAEVFVLHQGELDEMVDDVVVDVPMVGRDVVSGTVTKRTPQDWNAFLAENVTGILQMRNVLQLKSNVLHPGRVAAQEIQGVVIRPAAQEYEEILDPVRHPKA